MARDDKRNKVKIPEYKVENATIMFRNFSGKKTEYNEEGNRNFVLFVPEEDVEGLLSYGWNVKRLKPRDDNPIGQAYLTVKVKYGIIPPMATLITSRGKTRLDEDTIGQLDWTRMENVDLIIRPYQYPPSNIRPEGGVSAYLKCIYVTLKEDELEKKYADIRWADEADEEADELPFSYDE